MAANTATSEAGNAKVLAHNSDGYLVEVMEGELLIPEPPPPPKKKQGRDWARKDRASRPRPDQRGKKNVLVKMYSEIPGYLEWHIAKTTESRMLNPDDQGHPIGQTPGYTVKQANRVWDKARKLARKDMAEIKKKIDLNEAAEDALSSVLEVMRGPVSTKDKLAAAGKVLEYTMAKPVAKSEVTVNAAEAWLASLKDEDDGDKDLH